MNAGDQEAAAAAVAAAAAQTPPGCQAVVLGCTEYELAARQISEAVPGAVTFGSAVAVAAQALRLAISSARWPAYAAPGTPAANGRQRTGSPNPAAPGTGHPGPGRTGHGDLPPGVPELSACC